MQAIFSECDNGQNILSENVGQEILWTMKIHMKLYNVLSNIWSASNHKFVSGTMWVSLCVCVHAAICEGVFRMFNEMGNVKCDVRYDFTMLISIPGKVLYICYKIVQQSIVTTISCTVKLWNAD